MCAGVPGMSQYIKWIEDRLSHQSFLFRSFNTFLISHMGLQLQALHAWDGEQRRPFFLSQKKFSLFAENSSTR